MITIKAQVIQGLIIEKMLDGMFEEAKKILEECLFGINDEQINSILEGNAKLIDDIYGMDIQYIENKEYKSKLALLREKLNTSDTFKREKEREKIIHQFKMDHFKFESYYLGDDLVSFPKDIMDAILNTEKELKLKSKYQWLEDANLINLIDKIINVSESDINKVQSLINNIKFFGYKKLDFMMFKDENHFGKLTGVLKNLDNIEKLNDTDILFLDLDSPSLISNYVKYFNKVGGVIAYGYCHKLLAHFSIFNNSREKHEVIPLALIKPTDKSILINLMNKKITLNFREKVLYSKD